MNNQTIYITGEARKKGYDNYTCADDISSLLKLIYQEKLINKEASQLIKNMVAHL